MTAKKKSDHEELIQLNVKSIPATLVQKLQVIATMENVSFGEIYQKAFSTYVELYEQKNGKVKIKPQGGGLDVL